MEGECQPKYSIKETISRCFKRFVAFGCPKTPPDPLKRHIQPKSKICPFRINTLETQFLGSIDKLPEICYTYPMNNTQDVFEARIIAVIADLQSILADYAENKRLTEESVKGVFESIPQNN